MKISIPLLVASSCLFSSAQTLLFQDNFDVPDNTSFDAADTTGRLSGTLLSDVVLRAHRAQQQISGNQLLLIPGTAGVRFNRTDVPFSANTRFDWASAPTGTAITSSGGFKVTFDWTPDNNTGNEWIMWAVGTPNGDTGGSIVNAATTDYGILFRKNGLTQRFDNGTVLGSDASFPTTAGGTTTYQVTIEYSFADFNDGSNVTVVATVDGTEVANETFQWDDNLGSMHMEMATNVAGHRIDNLAVSTLGDAGYFFALNGNNFASGAPQGSLVGTLAGSTDGNPDPSSFSLIAGEGDTDNDKFQINGSNLEVGAFDFTGGNSINGQQYSVRIQGVGSGSLERVLTLTLAKDDDADNLLDDWETTWAGDLVSLSATNGDEDFDNDGLTDLAEFNLSNGAYPAIDPTKNDTDGDTLEDGEEITPSGSRPATDPTNSDTDIDGLSDLVETNSGTYVDTNDTGTNPTLCDTDGDFAGDSWEITYNTSPFDANSTPSPVGPVAIVPITDNASTGLDPAKTYTHLVSGGQSVTINGVTFDALDPTLVPANFAWDTMGNNMNALTARPGDWIPADAGVSLDVEALLTSFTYSGNGATPGSSQRYTLSNLTPGANYDLRIYSRMWDTEGSGRPIDLVFTNGDEIVQPFNSLPQDRPGITTGSSINNDAYYLTYQYTAQTTELVIDATIPLCSLPVSGSFHLYGLSNEIATGVPLGQILITGQSLLQNGQYVIGFRAKPQTTYKVTKSSNLVGDFLPLDPPLSVTTDVNGDGQALIPAFETSDLKEFYRIEE